MMMPSSRPHPPRAARRRLPTAPPRRNLAAATLLALCCIATASLGAQELTLADAVEIAQRQGYTARGAAAAVAAARWREDSYRARLFPQLSLRGTAPDINRAITPVIQPDGSTQFVERSQMNSSLTLEVAQPIRATGGEVFLSSGLSRLDLMGDESTRLWTSTPLVLGIRQQLFRPNALKWDREEQSLTANIAERDYAEARERVAEETAGAFFDAFAAEVALRNAQSNVAVNDSLFLLSKGRYDVGKIGENDLLQSELALLRARNAADAALLTRDRAHATLRRQLGMAPGQALTLAPPPRPPDVRADPAAAVAYAVQYRSEIREHELQRTQADRRVREARTSSGFGATVTAIAGLNQSATVLGDAYRSPLDQQRLSLAVEVPVLQWGAGRASVQAAQAEQDRVEQTVLANRQALEQEVHFAALELEQNGRQLEIAAKADTVADRRFEVAKNRYVIGKIGISDLYIAQNEKDGAVEAYVQALRGYWTSYYRLRRLTLYDFVVGAPIR
jgi:outer membrane protein TolC